MKYFVKRRESGHLRQDRRKIYLSEIKQYKYSNNERATQNQSFSQLLKSIEENDLSNHEND